MKDTTPIETLADLDSRVPERERRTLLMIAADGRRHERTMREDDETPRKGGYIVLDDLFYQVTRVRHDGRQITAWTRGAQREDPRRAHASPLRKHSLGKRR